MASFSTASSSSLASVRYSPTNQTSLSITLSRILVLLADFVLFYSPLLFAQAGLDPETSSFVASGVTGLILVACTAAGYFCEFPTRKEGELRLIHHWRTDIDRVGRRTLFVGGGAATSATLYILGFLYLTGAARTASGKWASIVFIELFAVSFA